jgi:hypothetical protein
LAVSHLPDVTTARDRSTQAYFKVWHALMSRANEISVGCVRQNEMSKVGVRLLGLFLNHIISNVTMPTRKIK